MSDPEELPLSALEDSSDGRGWSFSLDQERLSIMSAVKGVHIAAIRPGAVRGNHYHLERTELITVLFQDLWSLHWDTGEGTSTHHRRFDGSGAISLVPPAGWSHAVRNDGSTDLMIVAFNDKSFDDRADDPSTRDTFPRVVTD